MTLHSEFCLNVLTCGNYAAPHQKYCWECLDKQQAQKRDRPAVIDQKAENRERYEHRHAKDGKK